MAAQAFFAGHRRLWLALCSVFFLVASWELVLTYIFPVDPFFFTKPSLIAAIRSGSPDNLCPAAF
jgi:hypothetical protein